MKVLGIILVMLVVLIHFGFLVLEMFFWDHPVGREIFSMTPAESAASAVLAMNQGLYNGFLAAGLIWGLLSGRLDVKVFFLLCIIVAGVFGALTAKITILFSQALPALLALMVVWLSAGNARPTDPA